jgi:hypothetical protein
VSTDLTALPVLLFEKAKQGDLDKFACSGLGKAVSIENRLKLCAEVAYAIDNTTYMRYVPPTLDHADSH